MTRLRHASWLICLLAMLAVGCSIEGSNPDPPDPTTPTTDTVLAAHEPLDVEVLEGDGFDTLARTAPLDADDLRFGSAVSGELVVDPDSGCLMLNDALLVLPHGATLDLVAGTISIAGYPPLVVGDSIEGPGVTMGADALIMPGADTGACQVTDDQAVAELYVPGPND